MGFPPLSLGRIAQIKDLSCPLEYTWKVRRRSTPFWCLLDIVPIKNEKRDVVLFLVSHKDISKQKDKQDKHQDKPDGAKEDNKGETPLLHLGPCTGRWTGPRLLYGSPWSPCLAGLTIRLSAVRELAETLETAMGLSSIVQSLELLLIVHTGCEPTLQGFGFGYDDVGYGDTEESVNKESDNDDSSDDDDSDDGAKDDDMPKNYDYGRRRSRAVLYHISGQLNKQNKAKSKLQQLNMLASQMPEYKVQEVKKSSFVIVHYGIFKIGWDWLILLCTVYIAIMVPFNAAFRKFDARKSGRFRDFMYIDAGVEVLFAIDIVLNFRTTYLNKSGQVVYESRLIAMNYISGWFVLDLLAAIPFDLLYTFSVQTGGLLGKMVNFRTTFMFSLTSSFSPHYHLSPPHSSHSFSLSPKPCFYLTASFYDLVLENQTFSFDLTDLL
ncbi:hypothetical protein RRG08_044266 [Elysia crispata]|uniref:PAC domain-containing protein n=1 Tax=Elysia crispata TaxID=231223 RepID=A0AAE1CNU2_9GAST|nr:hypothetical protein RRG08_044266 [Elysia crispata]